jgi:inositol-phosphate phosphatase / L-galactose 1-phosphate phosphatase / histidinol-phosphatase
MDEIARRIMLAETLADLSGEVIKKYFRQPHIQTETKIEEVSSIVTIADREAEEIMVETILKNSPGDGIIREEGEDIISQNGRYWVLDPIDGTASFVRGLPIFGTLIGAIDLESKSPSIGILNQPILEEIWLGVSGKTTLFNRQKLVNSYSQNTNSKLTEACLMSTTPLMFISDRQKAISKALQKACQRTAFGGDCYNYGALASGWTSMPVIALECGMKYYDFCALIPIIEGVGGVITDWSGEKLNNKSTEVIAASNYSLWKQAIAVIKKLDYS